MAFSVGERELRVAPLHREAEKIRAPAPLGVDGFVFRDGARDGGVLRRGAEFIELRGVRLACVYAADKPFICQELFALVGFDDYDMKSHVLVSDKYKQLKASLRPGQQIMIIPGGCYGQDPKPFIDFAQANAEVGAIVCFLWYDNKTNTVGAPGIRSGPLRSAYREAGRSVIS